MSRPWPSIPGRARARSTWGRKLARCSRRPVSEALANSRAVTAQHLPLATYPDNSPSATLANGKKKRILYADGMLTDIMPIHVSREYDLGIVVNGLSMHPSALGPGTPE